jgi:hypothetical protein
MCSSRLAKWLKLQERLPSKCEALSSKPHPAKKKKKERKKENNVFMVEMKITVLGFPSVCLW